MITNDRQYKIAKSQIEKFKQALKHEPEMHVEGDLHPVILQAEKDAINFQLHRLIDSVHEYQDLKEGKIIIAPVTKLEDLPIALIKSRIANGLTQQELAEKLGLKEQQIQKYEAERYETASLKTLLRIADKLKVKLTGEIQIKEITPTNEVVAAKYPFKQMFQRKWFKHFKGTYNEAIKHSNELLENLFESAGISNKRKFALNKRSVRLTNFNEFALKAWYARVIIKAKDQDLDVIFKKESLTEEWIHKLTKLSVESNAPIKACNYLRNSGIRVVIEPHLEGTYLDGAALLLDDFYPVIALTLRHDRLDNFWFVLLHEIGHIKLHLGIQFTMIFDDLDVPVNGIESEADKFALNSLIPDEIWRKSLVRFSASEKTIINQARTLNIHSALIAGRIRRETGRYFEFNNLVGQGEVRRYFNDELTE